MTDTLTALRSSVDRLAALVRPLHDDELTEHAYPSAWSVGDVLSHVGSSGVILQRRLDDSLAGKETPDDFPQGVWDEWDHKSPRGKTDDGLAEDAALLGRLEDMSADDRSRVAVQFGPLTFDWNQVVETRLNEHLLHEWDVRVSLNPSAPLGTDGVPFVVDNLDLIGRYTANPVAPDRTITVATTDPERTFAITIDKKHIDFTATDPVDDPHLTMPAEAFIRLVYGRLDPDHTPATVHGDHDALEQLRQVFPGP